MDNKGARPKETSDTRRGCGAYVKIPNMDDKGARPKEKGPARCGGVRQRQSMDSQLSSRSETCQFVRHLSVRLCDVLDKVGASAKFRKLRQGCALSREIIKTLFAQPYSPQPASYFIFGSTSEGTTTPGMNSDTDILECQDDIPVVDNISDAGDGHSLLMVRDKHTQPGYVKLQLVNNGQPLTVYTRDIDRDIDTDFEESDGEGRICLSHVSKLGMNNTVYDRNAPADTSIDRNSDHVYSFRCSKIPENSTEWINRTRQKWPSKSMLDKMVTMGCFVVGVGHPASKEKTIEWRLSFSLQERELMFSMNLVQHKCYILLKLIKKDLMEPFIGKSISSYHLKTCMFYVIENTEAKLWKRINLAQCVFLCLHVLFKWVLEGYCPNFIIKDENMFDREIHRRQRKNVVQYLNHLLSNGCEFLFQIKLDCIGYILKRVKSNVHIDNDLKSMITVKMHTIVNAIRYNVILCYTLNDSKTPLQNLEKLHTTRLYLTQTKCINDHTEPQTQEAISYIIPFVHIQLAQSYASLAFSIDEFDVKYRLLQSCKYHLDQGRHSDITSTRLLQVTILYRLEQYEKCILILDQLEQELSQNRLPVCGCYAHNYISLNQDHIQELKNLTVTSILSRTSKCVIFHNSDITIIPTALQYEMYRSVGTPRGSRQKEFDRWMDMAVVDAVVYLLFMKYLVYVNCNQVLNKQLAINKLKSVLKNEISLFHRETGYNLLGWIYFNEGRIRQGIEYFRKSWSLQPHHNAAKFHVMFYIFGDRNN